MIAAMDLQSLTSFQLSFQPVLEKTTRQFVCDTYTILRDPELNESITQIERLVIKGGKRARPYICALAYMTTSGKNCTEIANILVAIELFHMFGLIHDDIIDQGDKRHNQTTLHRFVAQQSHGHTGDHEHRGMAQAILMGDLVYAWASQLVAHTCLSANTSTAKQVWDYWHTMSLSVLAGQMLDTASATRKRFTHEQIIQTIELKTAAYSVVGPMKLGGALAGASDDFMTFAEAYGKAFGTAYQLQDDLLDLLQTEGTTDKTAGRDVGQHTYITDYIATHGTPNEQKKLRAIQQDAHPSSLALRRLVIASKTDEAIRRHITNYFREARALLMEGPLPPDKQQPWVSLIEILENRDR